MYVKDVDMSTNLRPLLVGVGDGDRVVPGEQNPIKPPIWARYPIDQV